MEVVLAIGGAILLFAGAMCLFAVCAIGIAFLFIRDPVSKASNLQSLKKIAITCALLLLVGTGMCALQFQFYPLNIH
jgi:hypothetical protein